MDFSDHKYKTPQKGKILISEPFLLDPNFKRTIVLLTEHNELGSVGFILNKNTGIILSQIIEDFPEFEAPVYYGGPVSVNTLQFIHKAGPIIEDSIEIQDGLYWGGSFDQLKSLIEMGKLDPADFRFYLGYSGWAEGQLEDEISINSWIVHSISNEDVFTEDNDSLWTKILKTMGRKYAIMASFPDNPSVN